MREIADLGLLGGEVDLAHLVSRLITIDILDGELILGEINEVTILQVDRVGGVRDDRADVGGKKILPFPEPDDERTTEPGADNETGGVGMHHGDAIGAGDLLQGLAHGGDETPPGIRACDRVVDTPDEVGEDFGIGLRKKDMALLQKPTFDRLVVLDDTVVNECEPAAGIEVGVRVRIGRFPVGRPAGVADAAGPAHRVLGDEGLEVGDPPALFTGRENVARVHHGHAGRVITPILETPQPFEEDGGGRGLADVADYTTHKFKKIQNPVEDTVERALNQKICHQNSAHFDGLVLD